MIFTKEDLMKKRMELYEYLRTQFKTVDEAKKFMHCFCNEMEQEIEGIGEFTARAMACHCSMVLEGCSEELKTVPTNYLATKYGPELYWAAWSSE